MDLGTFGGVRGLAYVLTTVVALVAAPAALAQVTQLQAQSPGDRPVTLNTRESALAAPKHAGQSAIPITSFTHLGMVEV